MSSQRMILHFCSVDCDDQLLQREAEQGGADLFHHRETGDHRGYSDRRVRDDGAGVHGKF